MKRATIHLLLLFVLTLFTFIANNGALEANIMEARNLTTAREMLDKGNWFEPTMNGELRFEKPPLPTWATAVTMMVFGQDNLSLLRLPSALAAMLLIFFLFKLTEELTGDDKLPLIVGGTAATSFYIFFMARDISWDIFCHSFMIGAIWQLHRGLNKEKDNYGNFTASALLMGLSFLSKGPVAFFALLLPYLIARMVAFGFAPFKANYKPLFLLIAIVLVISTVWPLYIYLKHPDFSAYVAAKESAAWMNRSVKPFYHYASFPAQSGIWAILATIALIFPYAKKRIEQFGSYKFLTIWVWAAVFLLSLFPEKKERYLLPVLLPLAMITAYFIRYLIKAYEEGTATKADTLLLRINGGLMALISFIVPIALPLLIQKNGLSPNPYITIPAFILFWGIAFLIGHSVLKLKPAGMWVGMVLLVVTACLFVVRQAPKIITKNKEFRPYYELRHRQELNNLPFFRNEDVSGKFLEVVWACGREVKYWDPQKSEQLPVDAPIVFLSAQKAVEVLSPEILQNYRVEEIGLFDANLQERWGSNVLKNYVTLIQPKN